MQVAYQLNLGGRSCYVNMIHRLNFFLSGYLQSIAHYGHPIMSCACVGLLMVLCILHARIPKV